MLAHPDDESFFAAGTAALAAAEGRRVELIVATRGEAGSLPPGEQMSPQQLAEVRTGELMAVAGILGINNVHFLGMADRAVADAVPDNVRTVAALLRAHRPAVVFTFAPDGFNRHPDHMAMHALTTAAVARAADPDADLPGQALPDPRVVETTAVEPWLPHEPGALAGSEGVDYLIDIRRLGTLKQRALAAHRSQRHLIEPRFFNGGDPLASCRYEVFRHASGPGAGGPAPATSLFTGLR